MKPGADTASAAIITTARLGSHAPKISRNAKTFVGLTIPEISRPAPNTNPDNKDAIIRMILASEDVTGYSNGYNRCQHKDDGRSDGANRQPCHATDAVAGDAAAPQPGAEADQQAGRDDDGPACRHFGWWHPITRPACNQRRQNEPRDKGDAPILVVASKIQQAAEYAADAGDAAGQEHQQDRGQADQAATDRGGQRCEICHDVTPLIARARSPMRPTGRLTVASRAVARHCRQHSP